VTLYIAGTREGIKHGTAYLRRAADLWSLVDPRRGDAIREWLRSEWQAHDDDPDIQVYNVDSLRNLLGLLASLDDALRAEITDELFRLDPVVAARLKAENELLVDSWEGEDGHVDTLTNRVGEVHEVEALVKKAIEMNRSLEVD